MLFFLFYWFYGNKKSRFDDIDNLTLANIFLNTSIIELFVFATWSMSPNYGNIFDCLIFAVVAIIITYPLTKKGIFLLDENFGVIVFRFLLPLFMLWSVLRVSYFWLTTILISILWVKM